jgi:hypothetical protein
MPTPPDFTTGQVLTAAMMDRVGLWKVIPTSATNGTVGANGTVTIGNAVASVSVTCFNADFDNYRIIVNGPGSASANGNLIMTLNGGTTAYYGSLIYGLSTGTAPLLAAVDNAANWPYMAYSSTASGILTTIEIINPYLAEYTVVQATYVNTGGHGTFTGIRGADTSHTGFTLAPTTGTITGGSIHIYGYNSL